MFYNDREPTKEPILFDKTIKENILYGSGLTGGVTNKAFTDDTVSYSLIKVQCCYNMFMVNVAQKICNFCIFYNKSP